VKLRRLTVIICSVYRDLGNTGIVTSVSTVSIDVSWVSHDTNFNVRLKGDRLSLLNLPHLTYAYHLRESMNREMEGK